MTSPSSRSRHPFTTAPSRAKRKRRRGESLRPPPIRILCEAEGEGHDASLATTVGGSVLSKLKIGWRPAWVGAFLGLLIGFGGGAGAALIADAARPERRAIGLLPTSTPALPGRTPIPSPPPSSARQASVSRAASFSTGPAQPSATCGSPSARLVRFRVLVEPGLPTTPARFVQDVLSVLCDGRSWIASGKVRFRYDPDAALLIGLRTPESTEQRCRQLIGLSVNYYYSCASRSEAVLNADRWFHGSKHWPGPVLEYRRMLVNHEVGHTQGQHHRNCARDGGPAPVMMQQSKGLSSNGRTCLPNPWPLAYELRSLYG